MNSSKRDRGIRERSSLATILEVAIHGLALRHGANGFARVIDLEMA